jgi:hypothetical protein
MTTRGHTPNGRRTDFTTWSSTASSNLPAGSTAIGTGLDDNLRQIQAEVAKWRDGTGYGILTLTGVAGSNSITGSTSPAPTLAANQKYLLVPAGTNTGAVVLNVNSAGNKNVYAGNSAMVGGELHANIPVLVEYDGTQFQALGPVFKQPTSSILHYRQRDVHDSYRCDQDQSPIGRRWWVWELPAGLTV